MYQLSVAIYRCSCLLHTYSSWVTLRFLVLFLQFLSMKLATVNPRLDFSSERLLAKDVSSLERVLLLNCVMRFANRILANLISGAQCFTADVFCTSWSFIWSCIFPRYSNALSLPSPDSSTHVATWSSRHRKPF